MYEMVVNDQVTTFDERSDAVQAAKEFTAQPDRSATANVSDGVETLSFRNGKLIAYSYETRMDRRHKGPPSGADGNGNGSAQSNDESNAAEKPQTNETVKLEGEKTQE